MSFSGAGNYQLFEPEGGCFHPGNGLVTGLVALVGKKSFHLERYSKTASYLVDPH